MHLEISTIHEAYELKHALKHNVGRKEKLIGELEQLEEQLLNLKIDSKIIDKTVSKEIATLKRDNKTSIDIIRQLSGIVEEMKE